MRSGRYLLTGSDCFDQTGHNDFGVREGRRPGFFVLDSVSEGTCLLVCLKSHNYGSYPMFVMKELTELLRLEKVTIQTYSVFIENGCPQRGECGRRGSHSLQYCTSLIPSTYSQKDAVAFAYEGSFLTVKQYRLGLEKIGADQDIDGTKGTNWNEETE